MTGSRSGDVRRPRRAGRSDLWLVVCCLLLTGVMLWGAGLFDGEIADEVRVSNVYAAPGVDIDEASAEQIIGNRHLVAIYLDDDTDQGDVCDAVEDVAQGSFVAILDPELGMYGCSLLPGADDEDFGKAYVAEITMRFGVKMVADDPLQSARVMASTYDRLVAAGLAPQESRAITPPLGRYIVSGIAGTVVVVGSLGLYLRGRRLGHQLADASEGAASRHGKAARRDAALAAVGVRLLEADGHAQRILQRPAAQRTSADRRFLLLFQRLSKAYVDLNEYTAAAATDPQLNAQLRRIQELRDRMTALREPAQTHDAAP